jgi:hypothetical protein
LALTCPSQSANPGCHALRILLSFHEKAFSRGLKLPDRGIGAIELNEN